MKTKTKKAQAIVKQIDKFIKGYAASMGHEPEVVHIYPNQAEALQWKKGDRLFGVRLEVAR